VQRENYYVLWAIFPFLKHFWAFFPEKLFKKTWAIFPEKTPKKVGLFFRKNNPKKLGDISLKKGPKKICPKNVLGDISEQILGPYFTEI